jgi:hypothetical protein
MSQAAVLCTHWSLSVKLLVNLPKLNQDKTKLMIFAAKHRAKELTDFSISFGGNIIHGSVRV